MTYRGEPNVTLFEQGLNSLTAKYCPYSVIIMIIQRIVEHLHERQITAVTSLYFPAVSGGSRVLVGQSQLPLLGSRCRGPADHVK